MLVDDVQKIVHVCLCGPYTEGFTYQDNLLPKYHHRMGMDTYVIAPLEYYAKSGSVERKAEQTYRNQDGVTIIRIDDDSKSGLDNRFRTYSSITKIMSDIEPSTIFLHDLQFRSAMQVAEYAKSHEGKTRLFVDNHADYHNSATNWLSKNVLHRIIWKHYAKALEPFTARFWGVTPGRVDFLIENYNIPRSKCGLLVMGADDDEVQRASRAETRNSTRSRLGVTGDDCLIVTGGKFDRNKSEVLDLLASFRRIRHDGLKLLVFGPVNEELKVDFFSLCNAEGIAYIPWASASESYDFFAAADLVVFPGKHSVYWEQAVGLGAPLLVKKMQGFDHIDRGGNVAFLNPETAKDFDDALRSALEPERLAAMKARASTTATHFLYSSIARKSIDINWEDDDDAI